MTKGEREGGVEGEEGGVESRRLCCTATSTVFIHCTTTRITFRVVISLLPSIL